MRRMRVTTIGLLLIYLLLGGLNAAAQNKLLTLDDIYDPVKRLSFLNDPPPELTWLKDGAHYLQSRRDADGKITGLFKIDAATGAGVPFFDTAKMEATFTSRFNFPPAVARALARRDSYKLNPAETAMLLEQNDDLFYYELSGAAAKRLTSAAGAETNAEFSPDGRMVSFVRDNDLYVVEVATGRERALTTDGDEKLLNGRLDWIYEEELYGRGNTKGYWWSPDGRSIAYLQLDEKPVKTFVVVDHVPRGQKIEDTPYPLPGDPNPIVRLGVVEVGEGNAAQKTRWAEAGKYEPQDFLISRVSWSPDSRRVVFQAQNREQTFLDLNYAERADGKTGTLFRETSPAWVEVVDDPVWLADSSFLWRSERDGWMHIYHYAGDGKLRRRITSGKWEVRAINRVDEAAKRIYFTATEHSHIAEHAYRVDFDGANLTRLTRNEGQHRASFSPNAKYFFDFQSDATTPSRVTLSGADGSIVRTVVENKVDELKNFQLGTVEFTQVKARDNFPLEAMMIKPPNFDPHKKYPVLSFTYSGPHAPQVRNAWGGATYLWHQMMAQKGYVIWVCDNRTAGGKGAEATWPVYRNLGELELRDLEDGIAYLKKQSYVDPARIGLWGWSYGGFMTTYALTHSDTFRIGVAGGSVTDWLNYDSIYTERYMRTPQNNPEGYRRAAPVAAAGNLRGKLLLLHGTMDDNVHVQNTVNFAYELQKAGKQFDLMLYPKSRHGVTDPLLLKHMRTLMTEFILANL